MKPKKIYPIIIEKERMFDYYQMLIDDKFEIKIFKKDEDKEIYEYFLPVIRNKLFWTFTMESPNEFKKMKKDFQIAVCNNYFCNIFEKDDTRVICFSTGIIFVITTNEKIIESLVTEECQKCLEELNIRKNNSYQLEIRKEDAKLDINSEAYEYTYILELYKMIYLDKINNEIVNPNKFNRVRNEFVIFTQEIYDVQITDKDLIYEKIEKNLEIEELYVKVENKFDLLYKNNKLNEKRQNINICIILLVILIIIGIINLGNWIG